MYDWHVDWFVIDGSSVEKEHKFDLLELNRKYDVCSCVSQSEDINPGVLYVQTEFMKVYERACHEDWSSIPIGYFLSDHS